MRNLVQSLHDFEDAVKRKSPDRLETLGDQVKRSLPQAVRSLRGLIAKLQKAGKWNEKLDEYGLVVLGRYSKDPRAVQFVKEQGGVRSLLNRAVEGETDLRTYIEQTVRERLQQKSWLSRFGLELTVYAKTYHCAWYFAGAVVCGFAGLAPCAVMGVAADAACIHKAMAFAGTPGGDEMGTEEMAVKRGEKPWGREPKGTSSHQFGHGRKTTPGRNSTVAPRASPGASPSRQSRNLSLSSPGPPLLSLKLLFSSQSPLPPPLPAMFTPPAGGNADRSLGGRPRPLVFPSGFPFRPQTVEPARSTTTGWERRWACWKASDSRARAGSFSRK